MAFTIGDPRLQAISQAGANFGGSLGEILKQVIQNRQLSRAIQGSEGQGPLSTFTPIQEVISRFSDYNIAPELQNVYFSPAVQQRMMQQGMFNFVPGMQQMPGGTFPGMQPGQVPPGTAPTQMLASSQPQGAAEQKSDKPITSTPAMAAQQAGITPQAQSLQTAEQDMQVANRLPPAYSQQEFMRDYAIGGPDYANSQYQLRNNQRAVAQENIQEEQRLRGTAEGFLGRDFGEINNKLRDLAVMGMMQYSGTDEERYNKVRPLIESVNNRLNSISQGETPPLFGATRRGAYENFLKKEATVARNLVNDPRVPAAFKRDMIELVKSTEMAKGVGEIDAEYLANPLNDRTAKLINSMDNAPPKVPVDVLGFNKKAEAKLQQRVQQMTDIIAKTIEQDAFASPLIMRNRWLDKGYTEEQIADAFGKAQEMGVPFSVYQNEQIAKLGQRERPALSTIFGRRGEESLRGVWDILYTGRK